MEITTDTSFECIKPLAKRNILYNIASATLYRFWARANIRGFLWGSTRLDGEPFQYKGTGDELFKGFGIALFMIFGPIWLVSKLSQIALNPLIYSFIALFLYLLLSFISGIGIWRARAYILDRTYWKGINFSLSKSAIGFALRFLGHNILLALTFGWWHPKMRMSVARRIWQNTKWGNISFCFENKSTNLYPEFALGWFSTLILITLWNFLLKYLGVFDLIRNSQFYTLVFGYANFAMSWIFLVTAMAFYRAKALQEIANRISINGCIIRLEITARGFLFVTLKNAILMTVSLGLLAPFTASFYWKYIIDNLEIDIPPENLDAIFEHNEEISARAEGISDTWELPYFDMSPI